jgi:hypothetical protein
MFSNKTVGIAADILEQRTRTQLDAFIRKYEVPVEIYKDGFFPSKRSLLEHTFRSLQVLRRDDIIREMIEDLLRSGLLYNQREVLEASLGRDGYAIDGNHIVASEADAEKEQTTLEVLIHKHSKLSHSVLLHHLSQNRELFAEGNWGASIGQARNFVEQILTDISNILATARSESPKLNAPIEVRNYLESVGFLSSQERKRLIDGVYGYLSEEGSHPGISDHSSARVCRLIMLGIGQYLIEKHNSFSSK